jgi:type I restriction enzyme M protein
MLDSETKNRINTARDILVGKVPDPKSQVEQITIALIYKFMDDMDVESEELGGKRTFFVGEYAKYAWRKIFDPRQSGYDLLNLYSEAIAKMDTNPGVPKLFRDIFKNAYLPYRDPETLKSFLKIINEFEYSHSEKLGDAFEFLLSILGSQGDAGQFRTPRHIIDFMVAIMDPKKHEIILDPACGTAGFLISSYKHIVKQNSSNFTVDKDPGIATNGTQSVNEVILTTNGYSGDKLTADDRRILAENIHGYDISPDMVRLSLVNMYLHGVKEPKIFEYDSLTSEDHWNEYSDVILANPPFMSPKGGIRPHKRFSVQSNRSEVLFVDYIAEHLTTNGRACVIVPEGIIFQSGNAYKQLRKMLVEQYLVGVISLPAGVFNPYSGVKTSILWLDKSLAKKTDKILFVKIENDGFDLGAQRRAVKRNDMPGALQKILKYNHHVVYGIKIDFELTNDVSLVSRDEISANGDYNLSGSRYVKDAEQTSEYKFVELGSIAELKGGYAFKSEELLTEKAENCLPVIKIGNVDKSGRIALDSVQYYPYNESLERFVIKEKDILVAMTGATVGKVAVSSFNNLLLNQRVGLIRVKDESVLSAYISQLLLHEKFYDYCQKTAGGGAQGNISPNEILKFQIPLPSQTIQEEVITEIDNYQKIIDGARMVVENYKPRIEIDPEWEMVKICEVADINRETINPAKLYNDWFRYIDISSVENGTGVINLENIIKVDDAPSRARRVVTTGDVLLSTVRPNLKAYAYLGYLPDRAIASTGFAVLSSKESINSRFLFYMLFDESVQKQFIARMGKGAYPSINEKDVSEIVIPLPPTTKQLDIVRQLKKEEEIIAMNKELIAMYEQKIKDRIAKVWGE